MIADLVAPLGHRSRGLGIERFGPEVVRRRDAPAALQSRHPDRVSRPTIDVVSKQDEPIGQLLSLQELPHRENGAPGIERSVEELPVGLERVIEYVHVRSIGK